MALTAADIVRPICEVAPEASTAAWDNVGFQCGNPGQRVESVVIALDVLPSTIELAVREEAGLVIAHHPLLFKPITRLDPFRSPGRELTLLIENGIACYAAHTNVDRSHALSMNAEIGRRLGIDDAAPMAPAWKPAEMKLVTFVPTAQTERVRDALANAGAGVIGDYSHCSFGLAGTGTFLGGEASSPAVGEKGRIETVEEIRLEMVVPKSALARVLGALVTAHPYEEPAYDLYPLAGVESESQFVWLGTLAEAMPLAEFARKVGADLGDGRSDVRYAGDAARTVRRVAWTSGSGKSLIGLLDPTDVDVYLTGDTGHHDALDCLSSGMALVDLDHYYTERLFTGIIRRHLEQALPGGGVRFVEHDPGPVYRSILNERIP